MHFVDDTIFEDFPKWGFDKQKNYTTYYRLLVSRFVPEGIEKCLILDVDALVVCDIRELFAIDLGECIVAAVDHPAPTDSNVCAESLILHSKDGESFDIKKKLPYYICAGLMLLNMPLYRVNNIESQCLDFLRHYIPVHPEQDALNVVLNGKIMILPEEYGFLLANVYVKGYETYIHKLPYAKIVHYNARAKPWNTPAQNLKSHSKFIIRYPYYKQWWAYALQTPIFSTELKKIKTTHYNPFSFCLALIIFVLKFTEKYYIRPFAKKI